MARRTTWVLIVLCGVTLGVYAQVGGHDFVNLDDFDYVSENPRVNRGLSWQGVRWAFTAQHSANWHPLTTLSHMLDVQLFGLDPGPMHLVNVLFHLFNTVLTYQGEPQSYGGRPPGLSTRLFLRLGRSPCETICHLIYPASTPWRPSSSTQLILFDAAGKEVTTHALEIPCGGSLRWRVSEIFAAEDLARAGQSGYVIVRDGTCRLFGYHGLVNGETSFSFDHMFGF